jgi:hypothetical protein
MSEILKGYISRQALSEELGKSERTLERWGILRYGPAVTWIGRQPVYKIDSVREWLNSCEESKPRGSHNKRAGATA